MTLSVGTERAAAAAMVIAFARQHELESWLPQFDRIEVHLFADQDGLLRHLRSSGELEPDDQLAGLVAATVQGHICLLLPSGVESVRPEYLALEQGWRRLLAHELAHLMHEVMVNHDTDRLGPRWFFEGFACLVAGQRFLEEFDDSTPPEAVLAAVRRTGRSEYATFEAAVRYFSTLHGVQELVARAGDADFEDWLQG